MKYLILDFGKVLAYPTCGNWFITPLIKQIIPDIDGNKINEVLHKYPHLLDKKLTTMDEEYIMFIELFTNLYNDLNINLTKQEIELIAHDFVYNDSKYQFYEGIREELELLSSKYTLLMLTDNWPCVLPILEKYDLSKYFTKIYVSSIYDDKKERGTFFDYPIKDFNIKDGEALFIDDNESLLTIGKSKGLKVKQMDRECVINSSKHEIIHNLRNI